MTVLAASFAAASFATSTVVASSVAAVAAAASAAAGHALDELVYLVVGGYTVLYHLAREGQRLAGHGVVGVYHHLVAADRLYLSQYAVALGVIHGNDGSGIDVLQVELAVNRECLTA
jgi:hypothetical protein